MNRDWFVATEIAWGKVDSFPWWPCVVVKDPPEAIIASRIHLVRYEYCVKFFTGDPDEEDEFAWVTPEDLKKWHEFDPMPLSDDIKAPYEEAKAALAMQSEPQAPYLVGAAIPTDIIRTVQFPYMRLEKAIMNRALEHLGGKGKDSYSNMKKLLHDDLETGPLSEPADFWGCVLADGTLLTVGDCVRVQHGDRWDGIRVERIYVGSAQGQPVFVHGTSLAGRSDGSRLLSVEKRGRMATWAEVTRITVVRADEPGETGFCCPDLEPLPELPEEDALIEPPSPEDVLQDIGVPLPPGLTLKQMTADKVASTKPTNPKCVFCGKHDSSIIGPIKSSKKAGIYFHEMCALSLPEVWRAAPSQLVKAGLTPHETLGDHCWFNVAKSFKRAGPLRCSICSKLGAGVGCWVPSCRVSVHYHCACQTGWVYKPELHGQFFCEKHRKMV
ncbi:PWWP domain [Carpediemonas membranifera]|uniref:PWWP domain n=1 Tax=Carpediemonas membranifera TaxID=201153 RepID=A0A8J6B933_9EUKA|nr:PWWP domain [Carpediemonas membranifera]|eukprot:KAG9395729.1 PWWP domain [Carpediemonas membranifera]